MNYPEDAKSFVSMTTHILDSRAAHSSDTASDVLKLPEQVPSRGKEKPCFNMGKAVTITDTSFLSELKEKEEEKIAKEEGKKARETEKQKQERKRKQETAKAEKKERLGRKEETRTRKKGERRYTKGKGRARMNNEQRKLESTTCMFEDVSITVNSSLLCFSFSVIAGQPAQVAPS